eukprot:TRINITY_DN13380_c0_g1_i1.p1 TRINITY_DN13380_c0_g1~~TRINITY_DN13380_c0_g1_i1.p1  ORF type:complete len:447 (+),score=79.19 TRINITY_DN13380_c0_g1_i1:194-1534(+)
MAEGYFRASGKPGVLLVTSGPGATNTVTALQDAIMDGTAIIVFTGQVATHAIGTDAFQEADVVAITKPCTKWNYMVKKVSEIAPAMRHAFKVAMEGRPGPVLIDLPKDITSGILKAEELTKFADENVPPPKSQVTYTTSDFKRVAKMINNAERPVLYCGQGVILSEVTELVKQLAEKGNIPVTTTLLGLGGFSEDSPLSLQMLGMHGTAFANLAMQSADVIISLGARFDDRVTGSLAKFAPEAKKAAKEGRGGIIHFDVLQKNIAKVVPVQEGIIGDLKETLPQVLKFIEHKERKPWHNLISQWKKDLPFSFSSAKEPGRIKPQSVLVELNKQIAPFRDRVVFSTGVGQHQMWTAQWIKWTTPRSIITSGGLGTMGYGLPAAIGAQVACPEKIVIDIDGDTSLTMTFMEMCTAVQYPFMLFSVFVLVAILHTSFKKKSRIEVIVTL